MGGMHGKSAMAEFSKSDRGDETDTVSFSELIHGPHFRGTHVYLILKFFTDLVLWLLLQWQLLLINVFL